MRLRSKFLNCASALRIVAGVLCFAALASAHSSTLYFQNFDGATQGQSVIDAPINFDYELYGDMRVGAVSHPGWTTNAIVGSLTVPYTYPASNVYKSLPTLPSTGTLCLSYDTWAPSGASAYVGFSDPNSQGPLAHLLRLCTISSDNSWLFEESVISANEDTYSPANFMRNETVHAEIFLDQDDHLSWATISDQNGSYTTPKLATGALNFTGITVEEDVITGQGDDITNLMVTWNRGAAAPAPASTIAFLIGFARCRWNRSRRSSERNKQPIV